MKRKLYLRMTLVSVVMMLITMTVTVAMFYNLFSEQVMEDLKTHVHILKTTEAVLDYVEKGFDPKIDNLRITVIDKDGEVKYDSNADIGTMDNHVNRPEIKQALKTGEGNAERKSNTLDKTTYYYAEKMENGQVLRVAKEVGSKGIIVNALCPTKVKTPMCETQSYVEFINELTGKNFKDYKEMYAGVPFLDVEDISDMVYWLGTSRAAGKFNGRDVALDLGTLQC